MPENDVQGTEVVAPPDHSGIPYVVSQKIDRRLKKYKNRPVVLESPKPPQQEGKVPPNVPRDFVTYINRERKSDKKIT